MITIEKFVLPLFAAAAVMSSGGCTPQDHFKLADADGDGGVSKDEFELHLLESVFYKSDADRDGKVTFEEWQAVNPDADPARFKAPDTNRDNMVDPQEAKAHFESQGTLEDLFSKIDTDRSGYVSRAEAKAFHDKLKAQSGSTRIQQLYNIANE